MSDGSWISGDIAYDAGTKRVLSITGGEAEASSETLDAMAQKVQQFVRHVRRLTVFVIRQRFVKPWKIKPIWTFFSKLRMT